MIGRVLLMVTFCMWATNQAAAAEPQVAPYVDLERYLGDWYEIARIPNFFQRGCVGSKTHYEKSASGLSVVNECIKHSSKSISKGKAWVVDNQSNAKLKVQFVWPFRGDYWILQVGPHYEYAVVGEPSRKYGWILARTQVMDDETYGRLIEDIRKQGYDIRKFERTQVKTPE